MIETFADTFFYLAILNPKDASHRQAVEVSERLIGAVVTTQWVLIEVGDALCHPSDRPRFLRLLDDIADDVSLIVLPASDDQVRQGMVLYRARPDERWSLIDCISFHVMHERGIQEALTGDKHFGQAGYVPLLRGP